MTMETGHIGPGQVVDGKYRIVRLLGTGGMGAVYEGENLRIRRRVAIKVLHASVSENVEVVKRFEREAQAAALVGSEHICEVLDLGMLDDGTRFMVMEYLEGETLGQRIKKTGRLTPAQSTPLLVQVLEALGKAHAAGIIHRDLKPDNIFILPQRSSIRDFVKILDFGVSKFSQLASDEMSVTRAGAVVGTPYYMSPEQARGSAVVDARSDVYAIGVLLYQATTGQVPFQAETFNELLFKIVLDVAPPPQTYAPDLDADFAGIIQKAMARDPVQRFQSCAEFRDALLAYQAARLNGHPPLGPQVSYPSLAPLGSRPSLPQPFPGLEGSASVPGASVSLTATPPGGTPTASSWGNASSAEAPPRSRAPMLIGLFAGVSVLGGAIIAAVLFLGKPSSGKATTAPSAQPSSKPIATVSAPPLEPSTTPTATVTSTASVAITAPSATESAAPSSAALPAESATAGGKYLHWPGKATGGKPTTTSTSKPASGSTSRPGTPDLGY
uniref:non-specific serine/threonine protein kinase n=1 Tax=Byssovorax cruenta TaxID=293647 RepID=A0A3S5GXY7_9BACT|nr:protein kinase [Byssovorax cruenta]